MDFFANPIFGPQFNISLTLLFKAAQGRKTKIALLAVTAFRNVEILV